MKILAGLHGADGGDHEIGSATSPFDPTPRHRHGVQQALLLKWRTDSGQRAAARRDRRPCR
jgi:NitT/TauT family transport system ATP-binding protein